MQSCKTAITANMFIITGNFYKLLSIEDTRKF